MKNHLIENQRFLEKEFLFCEICFWLF